jgi:hypothetical protein
MNLEQLRSLSRTLDAIPAGAAWPFVYVAQGPDGFPVLLVQRRRVPLQQIRDLMRWTARSEMVQGFLVRAPDGVFLLDAPGGPDGWKDGLRAFFGPLVPELADVD